MTVGELLAELAAMNPSHNAWLAVNGTFVPVIGVSAVPNGDYIVIRAKGKPQQGNRLTVDEDGILGHLARLGLSDDQVAEVLGRSPESVKKRRKALGC